MELKEPTWTLSSRSTDMIRYLKQLADEGIEFMESPNFRMGTTHPYIIKPKFNENWKLRCMSIKNLKFLFNQEDEGYFGFEATMHLRRRWKKF
jgi:hypothetical protein